MESKRQAPAVSSCYQDLVSYVLGHQNYDEDRPILIDATEPDRSISLRQARRLVRQLVSGFSHSSLKDGDTVCLHLFNDIVYPLLFLGIVGSGGRFTGSNTAYKEKELERHLGLSQSKFVITAPQHLAVVRRAAAANGIPDSNIIVFEDGSVTESSEAHHGLTTIFELVGHGEQPWQSFDDEQSSRSRTVALMSTSGTTGLPKMAIRSHLSWVAENQAIEDSVEKPYEIKRLLSVPFFHAFAAPLALVDALRNGHTTYVMPKFHEATFLGSIEDLHITETAMPPALIAKLISMSEEAHAALGSLQLIWSGGAPLSAATEKSAYRIFSENCRISQVYGMTEAGWITTFHYPEVDHSCSVGRLVGDFEAKIVDDKGDEVVEYGLRGELLVRGTIIMSGYLDNPEAAERAFDGGWLRTGDIACFGEGGKLYIVDRIKDMIKVRGWQVSPTELEACLLEHGDIVDASVVGIENQSEGSEVPHAFVVLKAGSTLDEEGIKAFLLKSLARYKVSDCGVLIKSEIARSTNGKVLKDKLREEVQRGCVRSDSPMS